MGQFSTHLTSKIRTVGYKKSFPACQEVRQLVPRVVSPQGKADPKKFPDGTCLLLLCSSTSFFVLGFVGLFVYFLM